MNIKQKIKKDPFSLLLIVSVLIVSVSILINFEGLEYLRGLIYPTTTTDEISGQKANRLEVLVYEHDHQIDKEYSFNEGGSVSITQPEDFTGSVNSGDVIESNEDIKNIILEAPSSNFVGWSGCDADTRTTCQVSVTDYQKRKVEAHYSNPEPRDSLQLFSVSNNPLGGQLTDDWTNVNPELVYKAAYTNLSGSIPSTIDDLNPDLQLTLGGNNLSGPLPPEIEGLSRTDYIGLQKNQLEGEIPSTIGELSPIYLLAYKNQLEGEIPSTIGDMGSRVERLELHENQLEGEIPASLGSEIVDLTPSELRLYDNNLERAEPGLISDSLINGFNFHNNNFNRRYSMRVLEDAASRGGTYIDFCNNPTDGGTIYYDIEGKIRSTDIRDEVNAALEAGWDIYIPIELRQDYYVYGAHRPCGPTCQDDSTCPSVEVCETDDDGEEECWIECDPRSRCYPPTCGGTDEPPPGSVDCARLTDPIYSPTDVNPNSDGIPAADDLQGLRHVYHYNSCDWWIGPGDECEPVCIHEKFSCNSPDGCGVEESICEHQGEWEYVEEFGDPSYDQPSRGTCPSVKTTY